MADTDTLICLACAWSGTPEELTELYRNGCAYHQCPHCNSVEDTEGLTAINFTTAWADCFRALAASCLEQGHG